MRDDPLAGWFPDEPEEPGTASAPGARATEAAPAAPASAPSAWDDDGARHEARRPARRRLLALAAIPWTVAVVLAGALVMGEEPAGDDPAAPPSPLTAEDLQQAPAGSGHGAAASRGDPGEPPAAPDQGRAAPKLHARAALLTRELVTGQVDGDTMRYVDLAVTEHVTREGAVAIAVVSAYVLEGTPQRWDEGRTERYALALRDDGGLLAGPWPLDTAEEDVRTPRWDAADHEHAAVEQALADAGYEEVALGDVTASTELPGLIRVVARARGPGASAVESHELLLRDGDPPALLGSDRPSPPSPSPEREPLTSTEQTP